MQTCSGQARNRRAHIVTAFGAGLAMLVAWANSPTSYIPRPSFAKPVLEGFASLKSSTKPDEAIVATWWDYGYASRFFNDLPTVHDGGTQATPRTHFVATAMLAPNMETSVGTLKYISTDRYLELGRLNTKGELDKAFGRQAWPPREIFLAVTNQMAGWAGSFQQSATGTLKGPAHFTAQQLTARRSTTAAELPVQRVSKVAELPGHQDRPATRPPQRQPLLVGWTHTKDGSVLRSRSFDHDADHAIQIVQDGGRLTAYLLHRQLYESTFNKLYVQGLVEHPAISLHYDDYPHIRIYRIEGNPDG